MPVRRATSAPASREVTARRGGGAQDVAEAMPYYRLAAKQGHADAQCHLGRSFEEGAGVAQDLVEAVRALLRP